MKHKLRYLIALSILAVLPTIASCTYKEYDPKHPEEYSRFWSDEERRRSSPAYPFTDGARAERERRHSGPYGP